VLTSISVHVREREMSSKYDVVKLRVHLSSAHYYILSRFLLSKMLMFCRIPENAAVRISLDVKKYFVNCEHTTITQAELEAHLHQSIIAFGFSEAHTSLFPVVTQFHTERIPLVLLIAGPACRGKTTLAHLLSDRVNCSTIINTEVLHDISDSVSELLSRIAEKEGVPAVAESAGAENEVVAAVNAELEKAVREGKVLIVEGGQLNLAAFYHFLDPAFQRAAGAVILGVVVDSLDRPASTVSMEYGGATADLQPVYTSDCVSVMSTKARNSGRGGGGVLPPAVYIARCHAAGDNLELAAFLHDVVIERVVDELLHRGKMPECAERREADAAAFSESKVVTL
jgi:hypothetical protein